MLQKSAIAGLVNVLIKSIKVEDAYTEAIVIPLINTAASLRDLFVSAYHGSVISSALNKGSDMDLLIQGYQ